MIEERVSAKVPIVKFRHRKTMIEGDISLYNTLALQNTDLLRTYAEIDSRTKVLGHTVKYFAKICRIGDASCGSLSSYAYIVMMWVFYLENNFSDLNKSFYRLNNLKLTKSFLLRQIYYISKKYVTNVSICRFFKYSMAGILLKKHKTDDK